MYSTIQDRDRPVLIDNLISDEKASRIKENSEEKQKNLETISEKKEPDVRRVIKIKKESYSRRVSEQREQAIVEPRIESI